MAKRIFLTGATGYIGGAVLSLLLKSPEKFHISALVRQKEQGEILKSLGVTPIYGNLDDSEVLFNAAKTSDVVINTAFADHLPSVQSLVKGLKSQHKNDVIFIHTSGIAVITYAATKTPFDDEDIAKIHAFPNEAVHRPVDSWIFDNSDDIISAIIAPAFVYGLGNGPFAKTSKQVPSLTAITRASIARKQVGYISDRKDALWGNVNIHDLADLYLVLLTGLLSGTADHGKSGGWYFGTETEHSWYEISEFLGQVLYKLGKVSTPEISEFEDKYLNEYLLGPFVRNFLGTDCRSVANRSKRIGWKPHRPDIRYTLEEEIKHILKENNL